MNFIKKIIITFSLLFVWFFWTYSYVLADSVVGVWTWNSMDEQQLSEQVKLYQTIWQSLYAFTWPVLIIAGTFLNNNVIYWSFLWMDTQLWKMWNVMRTFANYIIWFILLFSIFSLFMWWKFERFNPIKLLPQLLIWAILVNASWFIIWTCIDLSNVLTYAVWTLPIKSAPDKIKEEIKKQSITKVWIKFQNDKNPILVGIVDQSNKILPFCSFTADWNNLIVKWIKKEWKEKPENSDCVYLCKWNYYKLKPGQKISIWQCQWSKVVPASAKPTIWLLWPFYSIYWWLLSLWKLVSFSWWSAGIMIMEVLLKLIFLLVLIIPLIVLAIILVVRAVLLWLYIVISPFIFLFTPLKNIGWNLLWEKWNLKNVCCMIFLPVFVVFALSMSVVFLSAVNFSIWNNINWQKWFMEYLWIQDDWQWTVSIKPTDDDNWSITIHPDLKNSSSTFATNFSDYDKFLTLVIKWVFWIWFMWIVVFTALKSCKITEKIASSAQRFSQNMLMSTPILPVAKWQSIASLTQWIRQVESLPWVKQSSDFTNKIQPFIDELQRRTSWVEKKSIENANVSAWNINKVSYVPKEIETTIRNNKIYKDLMDKKINDVVKDKKWLTYIASQMWITSSKLKEILNNIDWNKKISDVLNDSKFKTSINKELTKKNLKEFINDSILWKNITLLQLSNEAKWYVKISLKNVTWYVWEITQNKLLASALFKLWFNKNDIKKLLATNLENNKIPSDELKNLNKLVEDLSSDDTTKETENSNNTNLNKSTKEQENKTKEQENITEKQNNDENKK